MLEGFGRHEGHPYGPVRQEASFRRQRSASQGKLSASFALSKTLTKTSGHVGRSSFQAESRHVVKAAGMRDNMTGNL